MSNISFVSTAELSLEALPGFGANFILSHSLVCMCVYVLGMWAHAQHTSHDSFSLIDEDIVSVQRIHSCSICPHLGFIFTHIHTISF